MVTHNLKDAGNYGSRIIQMGEGDILKDVAGKEKEVYSKMSFTVGSDK
jgi:putative ABC transport system ATP-binding protein